VAWGLVADRLARLAGEEIAAFLEAAAKACDHPGQVLGLVEVAARSAAGRIGQVMIEAALTVSDGYTGPVAGHDCGREAVFKGTRGKTVATMSGPVSIERAWYHCDACQSGFAPLDALLGLTGKTSPGLAEACSLAGMEMSYRKASHLVEAVAGASLAPPSTLARRAKRVGQVAKHRADAEQDGADAGVLTFLPSGKAPRVAYMLADGTGAPMVPAETMGRPGKSPDGRAHTREVKIGCLFTQANPAPGVEPARDEGSNSYVATFGDADQFAGIVKTEHIRRGFYRAKQMVIIGDGAKWIWGIADRDWPQAVQIVDYYHACEHVHAIVNQLSFMLARPGELADAMIGHLDKGDIDAMTHDIDALRLKPKLFARIDKQLDYFRRNAHRMRYDYYRSKGWFIGSGQVESACKTIVAQRAKQSGMRWTINGLQPIITLRVLHQSGRDHLIWDRSLPQIDRAHAA
jgi:hypothetical protein